MNRLLQCRLAGMLQRSIIWLQTVINAAARLGLRVKKFDKISTAIQDELQRLRIGEHINFKLSVLMHKINV